MLFSEVRYYHFKLFFLVLLFLRQEITKLTYLWEKNLILLQNPEKKKKKLIPITEIELELIFIRLSSLAVYGFFTAEVFSPVQY